MKGTGGSRGTKRSAATSAFDRTGAIGFEAFRTTEQFAAPVYLGSEEALKLPFRALLTKRDPTTRIKALADLEQVFRDLDAEVCRDGLPHWAFLYERCQKDNERRVRMGTARVMAVLVEKVPKAMGERRFDFFSADWLCACFDPDVDCAALAKQSLDRANVQSFNAQSVLPRLYKYIRQRSPEESFEELGGTTEEISDRSARVRSQALTAAAFVIGKETSSNELDLSDLSESNWFKFLVANDDEGGALVRRSAYKLLDALAVTPHKDEILGSGPVTKAILRLPSEKERGATPAMWEALLRVIQDGTFLSSQPMDTLRKSFFPELFRHFDRRGNDAGFSALSNVVVLLSLLPIIVWEAFGASNFLREWFSRLASEANLSDPAVVQSALECLLFIAKKRPDLLVDGDALDVVRSQLSTLFHVFLRGPKGLHKRDVASLLVSLSQVSLLQFRLDDSVISMDDASSAIAIIELFVQSKAGEHRGLQTVISPSTMEITIRRGVESKVSESLMLNIGRLRAGFGECKDLVEFILESPDRFCAYPDLLSIIIKASVETSNATLSTIRQRFPSDDPGVQRALLRVVANLDDVILLDSSVIGPLLMTLDTQNLGGDTARFERLVLKHAPVDMLVGRVNQLTSQLQRIVKDASLFSSTAHQVKSELSALVEICSDDRIREHLGEEDRMYIYLARRFAGLAGKIEPDAQMPIMQWLKACRRFSDEKDRVAWFDLFWQLSEQHPEVASSLNGDALVNLLEQRGDEAFSHLIGADDANSKLALVWSALCDRSAQIELQFCFEDDEADAPRHVVAIKRIDLLNWAIRAPAGADNRVAAFRLLLANLHDVDNRRVILAQTSLKEGVDEVSRRAFVQAIAGTITPGSADWNNLKAILEWHVAEAAQNIMAYIGSTSYDEAGGASSESEKETLEEIGTSPVQVPADLKVGDHVQYSRSNGTVMQATVVGRHDDAQDGTYYTVRFWSEDQSHEAQTTRDRLVLTATANAPGLSDEERAKQLREVHRLLQEARMVNNRAESARLMVLQQSLLPKPKDSDEERAKTELARQRLEKQWREKRRLREERLRLGLAVDEDDTDGVDYRPMRALELSPECSRCLSDLALVDWRADSDLKLEESELEILREMFVAWSNREVLPASNEDLSNLARTMALVALPKNVISTDFMFRFVSRLSDVGSATVLNKALNRQSALVPEAAAGKVLSAWRERSLELDPKVLASLRYTSGSVARTLDHLFSVLKSSSSAETRALAFVLLVRYPRMSVIDTEESQAEIDTHDDEIAFAKSFFPTVLLDMIAQHGTDTGAGVQGSDALELQLSWLVFLRYMGVAWKTPNLGAKVRKCIGTFLRHNDLVFRIFDGLSFNMVLSDLDALPVLTPKERGPVDGSVEDESNSDALFVTRLYLLEGSVVESTIARSRLANRAFFQSVHSLPALVREWWSGHLSSRLDKDNVTHFMISMVTPFVLRQDLDELSEAANSGAWDKQELKVRPSLSSRKVVISYLKDDCSLEMEVTFPDNYPLSQVLVECTKQIGIKQEKWKRWALQIIMLLTKRDGTLSDAVSLWKQNLDKEFEGVEPCPICYSVLHAVDNSMPKLQCRTCKNTFHGKCLSQWFASSHQSLCPLCKQSFMSGH